MKVRIKFQKYGTMKFIGHLDVMRFFQKLFRRADIDNEYTKGFSPHQIMSFAAPLGVGLTSDGEYVDIQLLSNDEPQVMIDRMNAAATDGIKIIDFHPLQDPEEHKKVVTAMSLVSSADYLVSLKDGYDLGNIKSQDEFKSIFEKFLNEKEIVIDKKTKNSEKAVNIKPMISLVAFHEQEYKNQLKELVKPVLKELADPINVEAKPESVAEVYENGIKIYLQVDTGSSANLKPELVMEAFYDYLEIPYHKFAWQVHRIDAYTRDSEDSKLISLDQSDR